MHKEKVLPSSLCKVVDESVAWLSRQDGIGAGFAMLLYFYKFFFISKILFKRSVTNDKQ